MLLWELTRASAFVAFASYTLVVTWGILIAGRTFRPAAPAVHFHRFLGVLGLCALVTHVATILVDRYAKVGPLALVGVGARPSLLLGVIAAWLAVALPLSFRLRRARIIPQKAWRAFHYTGYLFWTLALLHGISRGTDTRSVYALAAYMGAAALVGGATWWRLGERESQRRRSTSTRAPAGRGASAAGTRRSASAAARDASAAPLRASGSAWSASSSRTGTTHSASGRAPTGSVRTTGTR
jgi:predicted ferric reductase